MNSTAPAPTSYEDPPTTINIRFAFCYAADCNLCDGVVTVSLDRLFTGSYIHADRRIDGDLLSDFAAPDEPLVFSTSLEEQVKFSGSLLVGVPDESGGASVLTQHDPTLRISISVNVAHLLANSTIYNPDHWTFGPKGACSNRFLS